MTLNNKTMFQKIIFESNLINKIRFSDLYTDKPMVYGVMSIKFNRRPN